MPEFRTGIGYDLHALKTGLPFVLGGIHIDHPTGPAGHSDGDVLLHALVDALLGAGALGDIGTHFPDTDPRWKGANSEIFVKEALKKLKGEKIELTFVDGIVSVEKPKLAPHFEKIRMNLSALTGLALNRISLKAKTGEGLGAIGSQEAIAAFVAVTVKTGSRMQDLSLKPRISFYV